MNFELIDNCFQIAVLLCAALAAIAAALLHKALHVDVAVGDAVRKQIALVQ